MKDYDDYYDDDYYDDDDMYDDDDDYYDDDDDDYNPYINEETPLTEFSDPADDEYDMVRYNRNDERSSSRYSVHNNHYIDDRRIPKLDPAKRIPHHN